MKRIVVVLIIVLISFFNSIVFAYNQDYLIDLPRIITSKELRAEREFEKAKFELKNTNELKIKIDKIVNVGESSRVRIFTLNRGFKRELFTPLISNLNIHSSNREVLKVTSNNWVYGISEGTVILTVKIGNVIIDEIEVTVKQEESFEVNWTDFGYKLNVPTDKVWTIKFNMDIDKNSVNSNTVYILDEFNNIIDTATDVKSNEIFVRTIEPYLHNTEYILYINGVLSSDGKVLKCPIKMKFKTELNQDEIYIISDNKVEIGYPLFLDLGGCSYSGDRFSWDILKAAKWSISDEEIAYLDPITKELWGYQKGQVIIMVELGDLKVDKTINILPLTVEEKADRKSVV